MKKYILLLTSLLSLFSCSNTLVSSTADTNDNDVNNKDSSDIIINLASNNSCYSVSNFDPIKTFNELDNGYKINVIDYSSCYDSNENGYTESYNDPDNSICQDFMDGKIDIIPDFISPKKYLSLANKGAFVNLDEFLNTDSDINYSSLNSHVLDLCKTNGKLYFMPLSFTVNTLCGYEKYVGKNENWTIEEMINYWNKMPEGSVFTMTETKDDVYASLIQSNLGSYIDYENGKCSFNSESFINILDFINSFEEPLSYKEDFAASEAFIHPVSIKGFQSFHQLLWDDNNEKISFVGFPSQSGSNSAIYTDMGTNFAISALASKEVQQGAWEFLSLLESSDYQYELMSGNNSYDDEGNEIVCSDIEYCFPMNVNAFEKRKNELLEKTDSSNEISIQGEKKDVGYFDQEECIRLLDIINKTTYIDFNIDQSIYMIISEEIQKMFSGEQTSSKTAENIQNRVTLIINE